MAETCPIEVNDGMTNVCLDNESENPAKQPNEPVYLETTTKTDSKENVAASENFKVPKQRSFRDLFHRKSSKVSVEKPLEEEAEESNSEDKDKEVNKNNDTGNGKEKRNTLTKKLKNLNIGSVISSKKDNADKENKMFSGFRYYLNQVASVFSLARPKSKTYLNADEEVKNIDSDETFKSVVNEVESEDTLRT